MAKKISKTLKLQITGGTATLLHHSVRCLVRPVNIGDFVTKFNAATQDSRGEKVSVVLTVYEDRTYDFVLKSLQHRFAHKGSWYPERFWKSSQESWFSDKAQIKEIAERKMPDLNAHDIEAAMKNC